MSHVYTLELLKSITEQYSGANQLIYTHINTAHEQTGQHAATLDADLAEFLEYYITTHSDQYEIVIFLHGDHGMRYGSWFSELPAY